MNFTASILYVKGNRIYHNPLEAGECSHKKLVLQVWLTQLKHYIHIADFHKNTMYVTETSHTPNNFHQFCLPCEKKTYRIHRSPKPEQRKPRLWLEWQLTHLEISYCSVHIVHVQKPLQHVGQTRERKCWEEEEEEEGFLPVLSLTYIRHRGPSTLGRSRNPSYLSCYSGTQAGRPCLHLCTSPPPTFFTQYHQAFTSLKHKNIFKSFHLHLTQMQNW